jgi:phospholipase C
VVIIFQENQSFDHYFGTYPNATNPVGEPPFHASLGTPTVNGLTAGLLTHNPNLDQPWRIDRAQAIQVIGTCDNNHGYNGEQQDYDHGLLDQFVKNNDCPPYPNFVMSYVDGRQLHYDSGSASAISEVSFCLKRPRELA